MATTIADIMKETGLSKATVAQILRNRPGFAQATRQRVLKASEKLGYTPNYLSKALAGGRSMSIGVLVESIEATIDIARMRAMEQAARDAGYLAYLISGGAAQCGQQERSARDLLSRRVDGLLIYQVLPPSEQTLGLLRESGIPHVFVDWAPKDAQWAVKMSIASAYRALAEHLQSAGHSRAAFVHTAFHRAHPDRKLNVCREQMHGLSIDLDLSERWLVPLSKSYEKQAENGRVIAERWLAAPERPSVLLCINDDLAAAIIAALADHGVRTPGDVAIVGSNDDALATLIRPRLTSIRQPRELVGTTAFRILSHLMEDQPELARQIPARLECELVVRESA